TIKTSASWLFCLSKVPKLGDIFHRVTEAIINISWYYHVTVLFYTWYSCVKISGLRAVYRSEYHSFITYFTVLDMLLLHFEANAIQITKMNCRDENHYYRQRKCFGV
ncbi:unnamed protein product, partial [Heterotrigona itama]